MSAHANDDLKYCTDCKNFCGSVFCSANEEVLHELDEFKTVQTFIKGQTLFVEGGPSFGLYCVDKGQFKLSKLSSEGKESIVRIVSTGELLGHRSVFANEPYQASATAITDAKVCFIETSKILGLIQENPAVAMRILGVISRDLGASEKKLADFSHKNVRERVAVLLIYLASHFGEKTDKGCRIDLKLTRDEMASIVGTATETLIRFLSEFKEDHIILQEKKLIYIINPEKLNKYSLGEI